MVLELTLKHVKALTSLLEQQQQKILALQNGMQIGELQNTRTNTYTLAHTQNCKMCMLNMMVLSDGMQMSTMNRQQQNCVGLKSNS